jgi:pimeloyl-ACP methyl ester carboxylesterase
MTPTQKQNLTEIAWKPTYRLIDGLSIRFVESEQRCADALLLSPWPESVLAYEPTWSRLAERTHVVAIDLPGFGRSEERDDVMSPQAMGEFIVSVADAFGLAKPHVIAPDIGTSATLFAASRHAERFLSLVVGSGGAAFPLNLEGPLRE